MKTLRFFLCVFFYSYFLFYIAYVMLSVDFTNPLGDQTTFVRTFTIN